MIPNSEFLTGKVYWTKGHEAGAEEERERIIRLLLDYGTTIDTRTAEEMIRGS